MTIKKILYALAILMLLAPMFILADEIRLGTDDEALIDAYSLAHRQLQ